MSDKKKRPKSASGAHAKKRIGMNFTEDWHAVIRQLAGRKKMVALWYVLDLVKAEATAAGIPTPKLPWEDTPTA